MFLTSFHMSCRGADQFMRFTSIFICLVFPLSVAKAVERVENDLRPSEEWSRSLLCAASKYAGEPNASLARRILLSKKEACEEPLQSSKSTENSLIPDNTWSDSLLCQASVYSSETNANMAKKILRARNLVCEGAQAHSENVFIQKADFTLAKSKCGELGFKQGTEGFGKCVLQLTK